MTTAKQIAKQRTDPDGDFDFRNEDLPDNTVIPVGRSENQKRKAKAKTDDTADTETAGE